MALVVTHTVTWPSYVSHKNAKMHTKEIITNFLANAGAD